MYWKQSSGKWADTCSSSQQRPGVLTTKIKCKCPEDRPGCNCGDLMGWNEADHGLTFVQQTYSYTYDSEGYMCWESTTNILSASLPIAFTLKMYVLGNKQGKTCLKLAYVHCTYMASTSPPANSSHIHNSLSNCGLFPLNTIVTQINM